MKNCHFLVTVLCFLLLECIDSSETKDLVQIPDHLPEINLDVTREERFPSRSYRVKVYMGSWYAPPCSNNDRVIYQKQNIDYNSFPQWVIRGKTNMLNASVYQMETLIKPDKAFVLDRGTILDCSKREGDPTYADRIQFRSNMHMYCVDVADSMLSVMNDVEYEIAIAGNQVEDVPIILQFGDLEHSHDFQFLSLPHIKKFRDATNSKDLERITSQECSSIVPPMTGMSVLQPIVWKLATHRHFGLLDHVAVKDIPWEEKQNIAIFRGQLTGSRDGYDGTLSDIQNCLNMRRCRLVYEHANSKLVNAKLTNTRGRLPDKLGGVKLTTESVTIRHLLRYKGIIMLEGNDVASGLKWSLLSNSVVLMPIPKHTSWAMEELLVPWVHYVPLADDLSDVEMKMQWVINHSDHARRISYAATLWIQDLVYHPDAAEEDRWIQEEIIRRYRQHFTAVDNNVKKEALQMS